MKMLSDRFPARLSGKRWRDQPATVLQFTAICSAPRSDRAKIAAWAERDAPHRKGARAHCRAGISGPLQSLEDRASHHPVLVALRQEAQFLCEMGDALAVSRLGERVREVGPP